MNTLPDLAGPEGLLAVADLGEFTPAGDCDAPVESTLHPPAGELDFLLEGPGLWGGSWYDPGEVGAMWGETNDRPAAITVSVERPAG